MRHDEPQRPAVVGRERGDPPLLYPPLVIPPSGTRRASSALPPALSHDGAGLFLACATPPRAAAETFFDTLLNCGAVTASTPPLASRRILVVDDQPSIRGILQLALTEAGADVWTADDGPTALRTMESGLPDLILLDLVMPGMNGWEVIHALSGSARTSRVPVVLQTSAEDFASFDRAKKQGVAAFISKPFRLSEVIETCRRILEGARPLQGTDIREDETPLTQVRDVKGNLLGVGRLLDRGSGGALVEIESSLALGQTVSLTYSDGAATSTVAGLVRWVSRVGDSFQCGLSIRKA